ncbi:MAG: DNA-processing protein DprA [Clostridia bacterium]|nr:DNA-processing protein DprA [Clostridia bacterium]
MDKTILWLWLSLHLGEGTRIYRNLLDHFGTIEAIYQSDDGAIMACNLLDGTQKSKIYDKNLDHAIEVKRWCDENGVEIYTCDDDDFPGGLRRLDDFPAVIYCLGNLPELEGELTIGIVGTRRMSVRGEKMAYNLGYCLSKGGAFTVSGMALGIDGTAQRGTLDAGGVTIAVLGSGIDVIYPKANQYLYERIIENGAIITEYPPNTPPNAYHFPVRNRLISGLSQGVVVVEGSDHSGSMITARLAKKQKRKVFAVPGPGGQYLSLGPNKLIKDGAIVVDNAVDILEQFLDYYSCCINLTAAKILPRVKKLNSYKVASSFDENRFYENTPDKEEEGLTKKVLNIFRRQNKNKEVDYIDPKKYDLSALTVDERKIYDAMDQGVMVTEENFIGFGYSISALSVIMFNLEMNGLIKGLPGGFYVKL